MSEYVLSQVFGQVLARFGLLGALIAAALFVVLVVLAKWALVLIERGRADDAREEREKAAMVAELAATRQQVNTFLTNHLEHLRVEREENSKVQERIALTLQETAINQRTLSEDLKAHRVESDSRAGKVYEKLENLRVQIAQKGGGL